MKKLDDAIIEVILFNVDGRVLAINVNFVEEILHEVEVSPLPFVPAYIEGLVNVNGIIMPQVNLAALLFDKVESLDVVTNKTILIVNIENILISLKIDNVKESISFKKSDLVNNESKNSKQDSNKKNSKKADVKVEEYFEFNNEKIIYFNASCLKDIVRSTAKPVGKQGFLGTVKKEHLHTERYTDFLIAQANMQEYAIDLSEVGEIVILESIQPLPRTPALIAGMSLIRGTPRLMLHFSELIGEPRGAYQGVGTAIMVDVDDMHIGIVVDTMVGLESIKQANIRQSIDKAHSTIMREDNRILTRVIRFADFLSAVTLANIRTYAPINKNFREQRKVHEIEMLRFKFGQEAYAFRLDQVRRIVSGKHIEPLLSEHAYLMGTMELEGHVIPVINLVKQLGCSETEITIIEYIILSDGVRDWALAIGEADQIIKVPEPEIDKVVNELATFVSAYCNIDDTLLTILNIKAICHENARHESIV